MPRRKKTPAIKKKKSLQSVFTRYMLIVAVFIFWIAAIGVRLVHLQVNQHAWLSEQALNQRQIERKSKMLRGTIYDRTERALAMSIKVNSLYADPTEIDDIEKTANDVSRILKVNKNELLKDLENGKKLDRRFVWLARKVDEKEFQKLNKELVDDDLKKTSFPKSAGLYWREEQKRSYPYKELAAHVVGFTNSEHLGRAGIEMSQEEALKGAEISTVHERDRLGRVYEEFETEREKPKDVVLTISNSIQYKTEVALARGAKKSNSKTGKAIVLDPKTGEILAMANYPSFDPNEGGDLNPSTWKNRAIQDNYSPGSVFKLITYGAALEEDIIEPENQVDCGEGKITVGGHTFTDSHTIGRVSYAKAFAHSSNVGAIKTGLKVGKDKFYKYAKNFGFGDQTGIRLPAETSGVLRSPKSWNGDSLASMSIGYEIDVTALQSASAFATIANDGVKVQPHIVKEIRQSDGKLYSSIEPKSERIVSEETARDLREMLRQVVTEGTAKQAQLKGYTSAGKTGTAWKYDAKLKAINKHKYVSSFIGFAPANNPRVVIAVVMDEPKGALRNGGQVAAPVFTEIAEQILPELNVTPDSSMLEDLLEADENQEQVEDDGLVDETDQKIDNKSIKEDSKKDSDPNKLTQKTPEKKDKRKKNGKKEKATPTDRKILLNRKTGARKNKKT